MARGQGLALERGRACAGAGATARACDGGAGAAESVAGGKLQNPLLLLRIGRKSRQEMQRRLKPAIAPRVRFSENFIQPLWNISVEFAGQFRAAGSLAGEHFEKRDAEGVEIGPHIRRRPGALLGSEIRHSICPDRRRARAGGGERHRDAHSEIRHSHTAGLREIAVDRGRREKNVFRFDVAVDDSALKAVLDGRQHLAQNVDGLRDGQLSLRDPRAQRSAGQIFADEVGRVRVRIEAQRLGDIGMRETGETDGWQIEIGDVHLVGRNFDRGELIGPKMMVSPPNLRSGALADGVVQNIFAHSLFRLRHQAPPIFFTAPLGPSD